MAISQLTANRLGFIILGLTNNFAYVIMLSAAYDLLKKANSPGEPSLPQNPIAYTYGSETTTTTTVPPAEQQRYCNEHSTSTILLADTLPSLTTKIIYPFLFVRVPIVYKAIAVAFFSSASFLITGFSSGNLPLILTGVICASLSSGLGESTYLSNTPLYGDAALSGWSIGTGAAGVLGAGIYALLATFLDTEAIMMVMHVAPVAMILAFFCVVKPIVGDEGAVSGRYTVRSNSQQEDNNQDIDKFVQKPIGNNQVKNYGASSGNSKLAKAPPTSTTDGGNLLVFQSPINNNSGGDLFDFQAKLLLLPSLTKYFGPLLLVYFAEYFINQGLFELVYYPDVGHLTKDEQYRWFQMTYQAGVMISRSSLDLFQIKYLWAMALLQAANALLFLSHTAQILHIPNFYIVESLIVYEGLLGGFTYVNAFYRIKKEIEPTKHEFCISTVTMADSLGIVMAGLVALPVHNALCKLYPTFIATSSAG